MQFSFTIEMFRNFSMRACLRDHESVELSVLRFDIKFRCHVGR